MQITPAGTLQPIRARRDIDAAANAGSFGGGIRAGSDIQGARLVGDGNASTGWNPEETDNPKDWWIELDLKELESSTLRAMRITNLVAIPGARLTDIQVNAVGDNLALNLKDRGGDMIFHIGDQTAAGSSLSNLASLNDGDFGTIWWSNAYDTEFEGATWATITADLGATYWVDWVRIVGRIIPDIYNSRNGRQLDLRRRFYLQKYELLSSDGSLAPDGSIDWEVRAPGHWTEFLNQQGWVEHEVDLQIYADGYPQEAKLRSGVLDLGPNRHVAGVHWGADTPPGTRVVVRSRSGNELTSELAYLNSSGVEVTERRYNKLIPSFRGGVDTLISVGSDWSPWSNPYNSSKALYESPSPRRYAELDVRLISDSPEAAASLDWVSL